MHQRGFFLGREGGVELDTFLHGFWCSLITHHKYYFLHPGKGDLNFMKFLVSSLLLMSATSVDASVHRSKPLIQRHSLRVELMLSRLSWNKGVRWVVLIQ